MSLRAILELLYGIVSLVRSWLQSSHDAAERQAGRDEAGVEQSRQNDARVAEAKAASDEAERDHRLHPDDDSAFDTSFRRD